MNIFEFLCKFLRCVYILTLTYKLWEVKYLTWGPLNSLVREGREGTIKLARIWFSAFLNPKPISLYSWGCPGKEDGQPEQDVVTGVFCQSASRFYCKSCLQYPSVSGGAHTWYACGFSIWWPLIFPSTSNREKASKDPSVLAVGGSVFIHEAHTALIVIHPRHF